MYIAAESREGSNDTGSIICLSRMYNYIIIAALAGLSNGFKIY
jgi:hypothetical protein